MQISKKLYLSQRQYFGFIPYPFSKSSRSSQKHSPEEKKKYAKPNVIKTLKMGFINPVTALSPRSTPGFCLLLLSASLPQAVYEMQPTSLKEKWTKLAACWVYFMQLSKKLRSFLINLDL